MTIQYCITFANQNPVTSVATVEGDQPRVRKFAMWFADETGFYFHTGTPKAIYEQLQRNPKVELCFYNPGNAPGAGTMLRETAAKQRWELHVHSDSINSWTDGGDLAETLISIACPRSLMNVTITTVVFLLGIVLALTGAAIMAHGSIFGDRTTPAAITIGIIGLSLIATSRKKQRGASHP